MNAEKNELEILLQENLRPIEYQWKFARQYVFGYVHLGIVFAIALFYLTGVMTRQFPVLPASIELARLLIFLIGVYLCFPFILRRCAVKRIPYFQVLFLIWISFSILDIFVMHRLILTYTNTSPFIHFINRCIGAVPFILVLSAIYSKCAAESLFENPDLYPSWRRYKGPKELLSLKLKKQNQGPIRYIEAQSPYVYVVTQNGRETLRLSFKEALDLLPRDGGWQLHRSNWVAKAEVSSVQYENGNPKVYLHDGTALGANRAVVSEIRDYLA